MIMALFLNVTARTALSELPVYAVVLTRKNLLRLSGDLLIVDSMHGYTENIYIYHVINVVIIGNYLKSRYGAIVITRSDSASVYVLLFNLVKNIVKLSR